MTMELPSIWALCSFSRRLALEFRLPDLSHRKGECVGHGQQNGARILRCHLPPCLLAVIIDFILKRRWFRLSLELAALVVVVVIALLLNNSANGVVSLGGGQSPLVSIVIMFGAIVLGIAARYFFYLVPGQFSWLGLLKPTMISPIVLIPLMGSMQTMSNLNSMQLVSFGLLAFQNGFFWQALLDSVRPVTKTMGKGHED